MLFGALAGVVFEPRQSREHIVELPRERGGVDAKRRGAFGAFTLRRLLLELRAKPRRAVFAFLGETFLGRHRLGHLARRGASIQQLSSRRLHRRLLRAPSLRLTLFERALRLAHILQTTLEM